ncbi:MAG: hypothetical protein ACJAU0_001679 [Flavobacteriales bacterium]|jgi:hypothetical protein
MPDWKIEHLAANEAALLPPEVQQILKEEIVKRNLNPQLSESVDRSSRAISKEELNEYVDLIRNYPCPHCKRNSQPLNGTVIASAISYILFTSYDENVVIACPKCLEKSCNNATLKSALLGWWGYHQGLILQSSLLWLT